MNLKRMLRLGVMPLLALALTSCAEERPPINRVQADALSKHFFVGNDLQDPADDPEFYWRNYVVDAPVSQSLIGVGSWSGVDRIRWEITEKFLIGRKAYQIAQGADNKGAAQKDPNGTIIASYAILSHFDIKRAYNPSTGEEQNVIEENTTDRPWYNREYMRVDWSTNVIDNPMWSDMFTGQLMGNITVEPLTYYDNDPNSENAPHFSPDEGYFDITNHYNIAPAETASPFSDIQPKVPTCMVVGIYTGSSTYDCDAQEAVVRSSFLRIDDKKEDFESLENTTAPLDVIGNPGGIGDSSSVGVITAGQQGWDPGYGYVDKLYHRFAHIHNVWEKSHQDVKCTDNTDLNDDGSADVCENAKTGYKGSSGSQCDTFVGKCTIPYRDRKIKTIGYWINKEMPTDLQDPVGSDGKPTSRGAAEDLAFSWNQLMSNGIAYSREVECRRTVSGDRDACHAQFFQTDKVMLSYGAWLTDQPKEATPAVTLCHNPVRSYDKQDTCGKTGYQARVGDLRHNFIFYWPYDSRAPWGGIADWNADPITGRIVGAAAEIMGRSVTYAAAMQRDVLQLAMGDITVDDIATGAPAGNFAHYLKNGSSPEGLSDAEIEKRTKNIDAAHAMLSLSPAPLDGATVNEKYASYVKMQGNTVADPTQQSTDLLQFNAITKPLQGSVYEAQLLDSHWLVNSLGLDPSTPLDSTVLDVASPLRGLDSGRLNAWRDMVQENMRLHGVCFMDDTEAPIAGSVDMQGLGGYFKAKYAKDDVLTRGEKIYHDLYVEAFKGIAIHEMGHSLGMLHQFASSWDSPNYNPQYWQLRTNEGKSTASCNGKARSAGDDSCMGPRYLDPQTDDEQGLAGESRPGIEYYANTSVMEYQIERFGETVGLGTYDQHVMNALYGRVLEVMDDDQHGGIAPSSQLAFAPRLETQLTEQDRITRVHPTLGNGTWPTHYTEVAREMKVFDPQRDCRVATADEKTRAEWRIVHGQICSPPPRDHAAWRDFTSGRTPDGQSAPFWQVNQLSRTAPRQVRWFYRWGTNHNAYFHTNDSDAGADPYEVMVNTERKFTVGYPFGYFRRQNREYNYTTIPSAVADRYYERARSYHWLVANSNAFYRTFGETIWDEISSDDDWQRPYLVAETEMFNFLAQSALMPEPGGYASQGVLPGQVHATYDLPQQGAGQFTIGIGDGRYVGEDYDETAAGGGSWDYLHWMSHAGFNTEKSFAMRALSDGRPNLFTISRSNFLDGRDVDINFRNDMPNALDRLVGGMLAEDWDAVSPYVTTNGTVSPQYLDLSDDAPKRKSGAMVLFPNIGYHQQLGTLMFIETFSRLNTDMTLVDKMRVWIDGQVGQVNVPDAQQMRFYNPASGYTYIARKYGTETIDGKIVEKGIASRMLQHANDLLIVSYEVEKNEDGTIAVDSYGTPVLTLDADGQAIPLDPDTTKLGDLTKYIGLIDATRQIGEELGYGPIGGMGNAGGGGDD